ncbi:ABC transporter substrate-binding protein [Leifsonia xyli]|uniref:ABC transporter substrate-binding protein n=1 Tax=Leifsonia xyli TaxID=1575 RepID=UPI0007D088CD
MQTTRALGALALAGSIALVVAGCSSSGNAAAGGSLKDNGDCKTITVLTNRTDIVKTTFADYAKTFEKQNPGHTVKFQAITNYDGDVRTRMNTKDYGDVLLIPSTITPSQFPQFFTPLGDSNDLSKDYYFTAAASYGGKTYGISQTGNATGYVVNKKIWEQAGVTTPPTTPDEFMADLAAIKSKTSAVPLYTNYKDGWPLTNYSNEFLGAVQGADGQNQLATDKAPWTDGKDLYVGNSILFDAVHDKLTESDPATTDWNTSKTLLGGGKIATMMLGSWSVIQMDDAAKQAGASASDIAFWPLPVQTDGKFTSVLSGDYNVAINKSSQCQATSKKWLDFFVNDSGYAADQGGISPKKGGTMPATLAAFDQLGVKTFELTPAPKGKENLLPSIQKAANLQLTDQTWYQKMVDIARGAAPGTKADYFKQLNSEWANGIQTAGN